MNFAEWEWEVLGALGGAVVFFWRFSRTLSKDIRDLERRLTDKIGSLGERAARIEGALFQTLEKKTEEY